MNIKRNINKFLCAWAQEIRTDENGNAMKKPDGTYYMKRKITFGDVAKNIIIWPGIAITTVWAIISWVGWMSSDMYAPGSIMPNLGNMPWVLKYPIEGIITICLGATFIIIIIIAPIVIIDKLWNWEIAECPYTEVPEYEQLPGIYPTEESTQGNETIEE